MSSEYNCSAPLRAAAGTTSPSQNEMREPRGERRFADGVGVASEDTPSETFEQAHRLLGGNTTLLRPDEL